MVSSKMSLFPQSAWTAAVAAAVGLGLAGSLTPAARATVYVSNNFDSGLGSWTTAGTDANATVTDTGAESPFTANAGGKSVAIYDNSKAVTPSFTSPNFNGATGTTNALVMSFDFEVLAYTDQENDTVQIKSSTGAVGVNMGFYSAASQTGPGLTSYVNGGTRVTLTASQSPALNTWYHMTIVGEALGSGSPTWSYAITDTSNAVLSSASGLGFQHPMANYNSMQYNFNVGTGTPVGGNFLVDNVLVQTPEPASLLMLGTAGTGILLMPRSKRNRA
ncbi:MAG: hypothetical protein HKL96_04120 [Phycisphaerales bacterium]|nr:hypothetical protein [Phycisphaerales bacterium]